MPNDNSANTPSGQVECSNCGAVHAAYDPRCPYCGALNAVGAEKTYMNELDDLKDDTGELAEDAERGFSASLQGNAKRIVLVVVIAVAVIGALFLVSNCMDKHEERQGIQSYQARESFRERHFAELDRLYESGDDAAMSAYAWGLMGEPGFDALFSWEHAGYLKVYDDWETVKLAQDDFREGKGDIDDYTWAVSLAVGLARLDGSGQRASAELTGAEEARAAGYRAFAREFLEETLQMNGEEVVAFAEAVLDDEGNVDDERLKRDLEQRLRQLGTIG